MHHDHNSANGPLLGADLVGRHGMPLRHYCFGIITPNACRKGGGLLIKEQSIRIGQSYAVTILNWILKSALLYMHNA